VKAWLFRLRDLWSVVHLRLSSASGCGSQQPGGILFAERLILEDFGKAFQKDNVPEFLEQCFKAAIALLLFDLAGRWLVRNHLTLPVLI